MWKPFNPHLRTCAPSEDSDQHAHSHSLMKIFTVRNLDRDRKRCKLSSYEQWMLQSDCTEAQAHYIVRCVPVRRHVFWRWDWYVSAKLVWPKWSKKASLWHQERSHHVMCEQQRLMSAYTPWIGLFYSPFFVLFCFCVYDFVLFLLTLLLLFVKIFLS